MMKKANGINSLTLTELQIDSLLNLNHPNIGLIYDILEDEQEMAFRINRSLRSSRFSAVIMNFPNNPTSKIVSANFYKQLSQVVKKENVLVESTSIFVNNIENHHKIHLSIDKNFSNLQSKKNVLLDIEKSFKTLFEKCQYRFKSWFLIINHLYTI